LSHGCIHNNLPSDQTKWQPKILPSQRFITTPNDESVPWNLVFFDSFSTGFC